MDYVVSTMHIQGFSRMFRPGNCARPGPTTTRSSAQQRSWRRAWPHGQDARETEYIAGTFSVAMRAVHKSPSGRRAA